MLLCKFIEDIKLIGDFTSKATIYFPHTNDSIHTLIPLSHLLIQISLIIIYMKIIGLTMISNSSVVGKLCKMYNDSCLAIYRQIYQKGENIETVLNAILKCYRKIK
jgi:hypothetical protein